MLSAMFIRSKKFPNRTTLQIVESRREGPRVLQKVLRHIGSAYNDEELADLKVLADNVLRRMAEERSPTLFGMEAMKKLDEAADKARKSRCETVVKLEDLREDERIVTGIHQVYGTLYDELGFNDVLGAREKHSAAVLREIVLARIAVPGSKRASVAALERDFGVTVNLSSVYRMMDRLTPKVVKRIEKCAWNASRSLLGESAIRAVLFDCTTVYFESTNEDGLRQKGYSKDGKHGRVQVLLALLTTVEGMPLGWRLFSGDTWEGSTLAGAVKQIQEQYGVERVVVTADAGLSTGKNMEYLESRGMHYVFGARLRSALNRREQELAVQLSEYERPDGWDDGSGYRVIEQCGGRRLIVHYSPVRARKDARDREQAIAQLLKRIGRSPSSLKKLATHRGNAKFLTFNGDAEVGIDQSKVAAAAQWDGITGIVTNDTERTPQALLHHYRQRWQIENTFRVTKHDMKVRPVFHWSTPRIEAHFAICFAALCCVRQLEKRIVMHSRQPLSAEVVRQELCHRQVSILTHVNNRNRYAIPSKATEIQRTIYRAMGLKVPSTTPFPLDSN